MNILFLSIPMAFAAGLVFGRMMRDRGYGLWHPYMVGGGALIGVACHAVSLAVFALAEAPR